MILSTKSVNRIFAFLLYAGVATMTVYAGSKLINSSLDSKFYRDYLIKWDVSIRALNAKQFKWPKLTRRNHMAYMTEIVEYMKNNSIEIPQSNTNYPWIYRMNKLWETSEDMFIVCFYNKIIIYGVPFKTLNKIELYVDGENNLKKGWFTGIKHAHSGNYTGQLKI